MELAVRFTRFSGISLSSKQFSIKRNVSFTFKGRRCCEKTFFRSSLPEVFSKKGVLKSFAKLTGIHLCQSLFFNEVVGLRQLYVYVHDLRSFYSHIKVPLQTSINGHYKFVYIYLYLYISISIYLYLSIYIYIG